MDRRLFLVAFSVAVLLVPALPGLLGVVGTALGYETANWFNADSDRAYIVPERTPSITLPGFWTLRPPSFIRASEGYPTIRFVPPSQQYSFGPASLVLLADRGLDGKQPGASSVAEKFTYIIVGEAPALAAYRGGIAGFRATSTTVTGATGLDTDSAASRAYRNYLAGEQQELVARMETTLHRPVETLFRYDAVLNGFAVRLTPAEATQLESLPGVERVVRDHPRKLLTDNGPAWIGAPGIWRGTATGGEPGTMGEGVVVGIIDTGVNIDHPSFADPGPFDGHDYSTYGIPFGPGYKGLCDPVLGTPFCNDKLVGVYDFTGTGPDDEIGHGSHTASTAAGNVLRAEVIAPTLTLTRTISGVAPHANVISYKACQVVTGDCLLSAILGAINQATLDRVDVINYSIGGSSSNPWSDLDAQAFLNAREAGIFVAASAGNDGPGAGTLGSPADAPWLLAVGASTHDRKLTNALVGMQGGDTAPPEDIEGKSLTIGYGPALIVYAGDYGAPLCGAGAANPATGEGESNPFPPGTFSGEIVVCDRGTYGRVHKGENLKEGGAGGYILANDADSGDSLVGDPHVLPAVHITFSDGMTLKAWLASGGGHTGRIRGFIPDEAPANGDVMASFSSRGPNPAVGGLVKPDVTAPGVDILAAFNDTIPPGPHTVYGVISGTSMSSPHAAGAAALVRALHPTWSPDQVKSALMTTAFTVLPGTGTEVHGVLKEDASTPADPFDMGAGRIDLRRAGIAGIVLDETVAKYRAADPAVGGDPTALNIASFGDARCISTCSWTRTVTSVASDPVTWTARVSAPAGMTLTVSPSVFTLGPGLSQTITVTANVAAVTPKGAWVFAEVRLTPGDAAVPEAHFPVAVVPSGEGIIPTTLHFHGNQHDGCTGDGAVDLVTGGISGECTPFLDPDPDLDTASAAFWGPITATVNGAAPRNIHDPNWEWSLTEPVTLKGPMVVEWWAAGPGSNLLLFDDFFIRLYADGVQVPLPNGGRVRHNIPVPNVPTFLQSTIEVPEVTANTSIVLQVDPIFVNQNESFIYYDSQAPCPGGTVGVCDSRVTMPILGVDVNDPPVAVDDSAFVANGGSVEIRVLDNDADPDGDPLSVQLVDLPFHGAVEPTLISTFIYTHDGSATTSDSFTYRVTDTAGQSDIATVFITISEECLLTTGSFFDNFESGAPGWTVDTAVVTPPSQPWRLTVDALAHSVTQSFFSDALAQEPVAGGVTKDDRLVSPLQSISPLTHVVFWHRFGFEFGFDGGVLEVSLDGGTSWADVIAAGGVFVVGGYTGLIDPANSGNPLRGRVAWTGGSDDNGVAGTVMVQVDIDLGALAGNEARFRWRLGQDELVPSTFPPFGWHVDDVRFTNLSERDPGCTPRNQPPVAANDQASVPRGGSVNIDVKANDSDPNDSTESLRVTIESDPAHGSAIVVQSDGTITYTHNGGSATSDSFQYRLADPQGAFDIATVSITIPNEPPVANDDSATVDRGRSVTIDVKANDSDPDDATDSWTVSIETPPSHGVAGVAGDGRITYTHDGSNTRSDSFTYTVSDGRGGTDSATVVITVLHAAETLENVIAEIEALIESDPDSSDKLEDVRDKLRVALAELNRSPPARQAAMGAIEGAIGDLDAAVSSGVLDASQGSGLMDRVAGAARTLAVDAIIEKTNGGGARGAKIDEAQRAVEEGDALRAAGSYKAAVNKYKDALGKAESA